MEDALLDILGTVGAPVTLSTPHARGLVRALASGSLVFARLVEVRKRDDGEAVVLEVDVECPQLPRHDVRTVERVAILCDPDGSMPEVFALRPDFPLVPHTNLRPWDYPKSLCLYDQPWAEVKLSWTAVGFVERIRWWLAQTARGTLHGGDQPLEPLLLPTAEPVIFPSDLLDDAGGAGSGYFDVTRVGSGGAMVVRRSTSARRDGTPAAPPHLIATVLRAAPSPHGVIRWTPPTLTALSVMLAPTLPDLEGELKTRLAVWIRNHGLHRCGVMLILLLPKRRTAVGPVEGVDFLAVECAGNLLSLAVKLGVVRNNAKRTRDMAKVVGMKGAIPRPGEDVLVALSRVTLALSRAQAAKLSGLPVRDARRYVAVGVGALGSQVVTNLVRTGSGEWTLIDGDTLLPHNLTRHVLSGWELGMPKADALARVLNVTIDGPPIAAAVVADVLSPGERAERVGQSLSRADVILDMSASQPVARHLAIDAASPARRVSLFLNPAGTSLVLLAEDAKRAVTLDALEMQYYREVVRRPEFSTHLRREEGGVRYAQSCRDVSSRLPTHLVALHAAIGCEAVRLAVARADAAIAVWTVDPVTLAVSHYAANPVAVHRQPAGEWELVIDAAVAAEMQSARAAKLPRETGGVLLGSYDQSRRIVYVSDVLPSPDDSVERPTLYVRGCKGLERSVSDVVARTDGQVGYVGEWHSHPNGVACLPSAYDVALFGWIGERLAPEGKPGLMGIVCEGNTSTWVIGGLDCRTRIGP